MAPITSHTDAHLDMDQSPNLIAGEVRVVYLTLVGWQSIDEDG